MTREEAIAKLVAYAFWASEHVPDDVAHALDMAIEALREMPVEEYRQRLMEVFHNTDHIELLTYVVMPKEEEFKFLEYILRQYKYEPRLHGEWIIHRNKQGAHIYSVCSKCNVPHLDTDFPNFCENCGSDNRKREGEKNESDHL